MTANSEQAEFWTARAPDWISIEAHVANLADEPTRQAMDLLGLHDGDRVLDIGCGIGGTTLDLASRVAPNGHVLGVDISPPMLEEAARRSSALGVTNVDWRVGDVQVEPLGDGFDVAFSRFGVMFFADPKAAFANVRSSMRPDGRLAFLCWKTISENEWALLPALSMMSVTDWQPEVPEPGAPGPFAFADPALPQAILEASGWREIGVTDLSGEMVVPEERIGEDAQASVRFGPVRMALEDRDDATRAAVAAAVETEMRQRVSGGVLSIKRGIWLVTARA